MVAHPNAGSNRHRLPEWEDQFEARGARIIARTSISLPRGPADRRSRIANPYLTWHHVPPANSQLGATSGPPRVPDLHLACLARHYGNVIFAVVRRQDARAFSVQQGQLHAQRRGLAAV